jgi:hypothetical protein
MYNDIAISNLSRLARIYHYNIIYHRDVVTADISISRGTTCYNANVDLLCKVCDKTIDCMNKDVFIRIDTLEDCAKCRKMHQA